jgi:hypothetical protein
VAEVERAKLGAFSVTLRPASRIHWPAKGPLPHDDRIDLDVGTGDLLILDHTPSRRVLGKEPFHESLTIELLQPLAEAVPGQLRIGRVIYRAGTERLTYQSTSAMGMLALVQILPDRFVLDATLTLVTPELDVERAGSRHLTGPIVVPRR